MGSVLRVARPETKIIATEPEGAQLLAGGSFTPHKIQGWTPNFVPQVLQNAQKEGFVAHSIVPVSDDEAIAAARQLAQKEGLFCGVSAGGTFAAALKVAEKAEKGSAILAMLPDTAERYLSTPLFAGINEGSDPEDELK